jgi:hypothetical protein
MKTFTLKVSLLSICLLVLGLAAQAQVKKKGETITTAPKLVVTKLKVSEGETFEVRGKATFTLTAANADDSLAGTLVYTLPEDARAKIAQITGKPLAQVPASVTQTDVVAQFQKLTECPVIHLDFSAMDVVVLGAKVHFNRFVLDISDQGKPIHMMVCKIAEQIKRGLPRRGPIRRINEIINGEEPQ